MKTVKQIADELGVSKEAVRKQLDKLPDSVTTVGSNRTTLINSSGEKLLKKLIQSKTPTVAPTEEPAETAIESLIRALQKELDIKNEQIRELNARISELNAALQTSLQTTQTALETSLQTTQTAQALHAGTIQQQLISGSSEPSEPAQVHISNPGFFSRIFGSKK